MNLRTLLLLLILLLKSNSSQAQYPNPPAYTGTNPSLSDNRAKIVAAGKRHRIPPHLLFGIAFRESGWAQYGSDGHTKFHWEPADAAGRHQIGVGIMQITVYPEDADFAKLCTDIDWNIA